MLTAVKASAGSGKTYALTTAFLGHLRRSLAHRPPACSGARPGRACAWPEILAVTFTNKAAAEMKERVIRSLKERALGRAHGPAGGWSQDEARAWLDTILRGLGSLNIRTIDSLLHLLLRLSALDLGLPPDFDPVFDEADVFTPLYDDLVSRAEAGSPYEAEMLARACRSLLLAGQGKGFAPAGALRDRLLEVFRHRLRRPGPLDADENELHARASALHADMRDALGLLMETIAERGLRPAATFQNFLAKCAAMGPLDAPPDSVYAAKPSLADCVLQASRSLVDEEAEEDYARLKQALAHLAGTGRVYVKAAVLAPFVRLSGDLLRALPGHQSRFGLAPAALWPAYAAGLLSGETGVSDALCRMGAGLGQMLVDEFQDTSREQWEALAPLALECLSRGGGLFYVGDVKQAIYGWRGGDARLFDEIPRDPEFQALAPETKTEPLDCNWRSREEIVRFNNGFFSRLAEPDTALATARAMLPQGAPETSVDRLARSIASAYADTAQKVPGQRDARGGLVRLSLFQDRNREGLDEQIRARLEELVTGDLARRRPLGQVAVLVRTNDEATLVSGWLMELGLPVITENSLLLDEHPLVRQAVSLLGFLDYPLDDLAFWGCASGSELFLDACGLSGDELDQWLAQRTLAEDKRPLYMAFRERFPEAWNEFLAPLHSRAGLMTPYDLAAEAFQRCRVLERRPHDALFARRFLETVHAAEEQGHASLSSFLEFWKESGSKEKTPLPEHVDAVRVMTIHKAKGLEFPVAVVPFSHSSLRTANELAACRTHGLDLLGPLGPELGDPYWERLEPMLLEQLNMLYVAWTRAAEELHAFITRTPSKRGTSPLLRALEVLLEPHGLDEETPDLHWGEAPCPGAAAEQPEPTPPPALPRPGEEPMAWLPHLKIFRSPLTGEGLAERARGVLAHRCLELLRPTGDAAADAKAAVDLALAGAPQPLGGAGREELRRDLEDMLAWLLSQPDLALALARGRAEMSLMDRDGEVLRPDLAALLPDESVVLEYKTGSPSPGHRAQVRRYLRLLAEITGKPARGVLAYLDLRRLEPVDLPGPKETGEDGP